MDTALYCGKTVAYKKRFVSRYSALDKAGIDTMIFESDRYLVSTKYDGHFSAIAYEAGTAVLITRSGVVIDDLPLLKEFAELMKSKGISQILVPGEVYFNENGRSRAFKVTSALASRSASLMFAAFDLLEKNGAEIQKNSVEIFEELCTIFPKEGTVHVVDGVVVPSKSDIKKLYEERVETGGHEGVVVKPEAGFVYKVKPQHSFDAVIIGFAEADGDRAGTIRDLLLAFMREDGSYQIFAHLHHSIPEDLRKSLITDLEYVESDYVEVARNHVGFQMVKPNRVIEFSCLDLVSENATSSILKPNLTFDGTKYHVNGSLPSVSCVIPKFIRFRDDKSAVYEDTRFEQVSDFVEVPAPDKEDSQVKSELLRRQVYVKESKGKKMVRKFLLWKTNKENQSNFPAYVFVYTDFSAGRQDPLDKSIVVSNTRESIEAAFDSEVADNIKKGWEQVS